MRNGVSARPACFLILSLIVAVTGTACRSGSGRTTTGLATYQLRVGPADPTDATIVPLQFLPGSLTVVRGSTLTWTWSGAEPHSVTFLPPGVTPPTRAESKPYLPAQEPADGQFDGAKLANSGVRSTRAGVPKPFTLKFTKEGTYTYHCVIYPSMVGTVHVVAPRDTADSVGAVAARAARELDSWLTEGRAAKRRLVNTGPRSTTVGGVTSWYVQMGAGTIHTTVLSFAPLPVQIKAGDQVIFVNNSYESHTASFANPTSLLPHDPDEAKKPVPGPSPQQLRKTGYFTTGWVRSKVLSGGQPTFAARTFTYLVPAAGTYSFVCLLHVQSGMAGTIKAT